MPGTVYQINDVVYANGITYICIKTHFNQVQTNTVYWMVLPGADFTNPMTTINDIIVAGVSGIPLRLAAGALNSVLRIDTFGNVNYLPATVNGTFLGAWSNALGFRRVASTIFDFTANTDFWNGGGVTASVRTAFAGPFSFTKLYDDTELLVMFRCQMFMVVAAASEVMTSFDMSVPSVGTVTRNLGSASENAANAQGNLFSGAGPVVMHGTAGGCSLQFFVYSNGVAISNLYCRASSQPAIEGFQVQVLEVG